jgi:hypothetical protein
MRIRLSRSFRSALRRIGARFVILGATSRPVLTTYRFFSVVFAVLRRIVAAAVAFAALWGAVAALERDEFCLSRFGIPKSGGF